MDKMPIELSGGMQKRVGIARALIGDPKIVLFDEPTAALDPPTSRTICNLIIELRDLEDVTSILVTHEMDTVEYLATAYAVVSDKGEVAVKTEGFIKVVVDAETDKLLGAAVLTMKGAELVHLYVDLMNADVPYTIIRDAIHIHPTLAEAAQNVFE